MDFEQFTNRVHGLVERYPHPDSLIPAARDLVGELLRSTRWLGSFLERTLYDTAFLDRQTNSIWPNELSLWRSPGGELSVLAFLWKPHTVDVIHDHGSWGVVGVVAQGLRETKYRRLDDGSVEGRAALEETSSLMIEPGETTFVLPLDAGIHQMQNAADRASISVNVYGRSVHRGYVRFFDAAAGAVWRVLPPRSHKRLTAVRALGAIDEPWAAEMLEKTAGMSLPDPIREERDRYLRALQDRGDQDQGGARA